MIRRLGFIVVLLLFVVDLLPIRAQSQPATVYGILFYAQGCGHCRALINNEWPPIQAEFGDQLQVLFVNIDEPQGIQYKREMETTLGIEAYSVPLLIIGSDVMIGASIAERAPDIIRTHLANGGLDFPPIPGIHDLYQSAVEHYQQAAPGSYGPTAVFSPVVVIDNSLMGRLAADPVANAVAILVLLLLALSLLLLVTAHWRAAFAHDSRMLHALRGRFRQGMLALLSLIGVGLTLSLLAGWNDEWIVLLLAGGESAVFLIGLVLLYRSFPAKPLSTGFVPLLSLAGLAAAGYLTSVEMTATEAVCGVVGNCNLVQQSPYARIFDVPIAVWGIAGYVGILVLWLLGRNRQAGAERALTVFVILGTGFSAYLTFLEPFVIGASCGWCLTSAVLMLMLLWVVALRPNPAPPTADTPIYQQGTFL